MIDAGQAYDPRIEAFSPVTVAKASEEVIAVLADAIRSGLFEPGDYLPPQRVLAARLQVSPTVVREASAALRRAGVVTIKRGKTGGVMVRSLAAIPALLASLEGRRAYELHELLELRRALESTSVPLAALRAKPPAVKRLARFVEEMETLAERPAELLGIDAAFHLTVAQAAGNRAIADALAPALDQLVVKLAGFPAASLDAAAVIAEQERLLRAIESGSERRAAQEIDAHLASFEVELLGARLRSPEPKRPRGQRAAARS